MQKSGIHGLPFHPGRFTRIVYCDSFKSGNVEKEERSINREILPVCRSKEEAERYYDRISKVYDYLAGTFERKYAEMALQRLSIKKGETLLEIGFGPGHSLKRMAESVGDEGRVYGVDISSGMVEVARRRLAKAGLTDRVELYRGDAAVLPYNAGMFDAVFMSFTLELFDTPDIPDILEEIKRVLKPGGRIGVAAMSREDERSLLLRLYERAHMKWPDYVDCRPIYVEQSIVAAGYGIRHKEK
jgi:ubiquinone/menaquinone biosynthesis C-methylase UbiE